MINLTEREKEVMELISKGLTNKEISKELCISLSTTATHIGHIYSKFGLENKNNDALGVIRIRLVLKYFEMMKRLI